MKFTLTTALLLCWLSMQAQKDSLDPVTVTATVSPLRLMNTGRDIIVISGEQVGKLPVHSIDEFLRYLPGVDVQARGAMGAQSDISLRGSTFQQVLVMLDGARINDPNTGHFSSYIPVTPAEIERIEILKGASSALYGSDAVGGVIHIITKTFAAKEKENGMQAFAAGKVGEFGLVGFNTGLYVKENRTRLAAGLLTNNTEGQPQRGTTGQFKGYTASVSLRQQVAEHIDISLRSVYDQRSFSAQNFYTTFVSDTAKEQTKMWWHQLRLAYTKNEHTLSIDAGYKNMLDRYRFNTTGPGNQSASRLWQATAKLAVKDKVVGIQFQQRSIASNDRGHHRRDYVGMFGVWNKNMGRWTLSPAVRVDKGDAVYINPQLNLSYRLKDWQFRSNIGTSIRDADFTELYNNYNKTLVMSGRIGNPWLTAERSTSMEIGFDKHFRQFVKLSATAFYRDGTGIIDYVVTPYSDMPRKDNLSNLGSYALAKNVSGVESKGIDVSLQMKRKQLQSMLGMVWMDSRTTETNPSFYILSHPRLLVNTTLRYESNLFAVGITAVFKQRHSLPDYAVYHLKLEGYLMAKLATVFIQADNIFDKDYQDIPGAQMPGRWISGGMQFDMNR